MSIDFPKITIPFLLPQKIEEIANVFRLKYWGTSIPVNVDMIVEDGLKIDLRPYLGLEKQIGILAFMPADLSYILYDYDQIEERIRYSIAHELGHYELHHSEIKKLRPNSIEEWKEFILNMPETTLSKVETQANMFASYLLIPKENLINCLNDIRDDIEKAIKIINGDYEILIDYLTPRLAKKFQVANQAMNFRLKNFESDFKEYFYKGGDKYAKE